jgi:hypothetical protein
MFAKTIISSGFFVIMLLGLIFAIKDQQYTLFAVGMGGYFLAAISSTLCKAYKKLI